MPDADSHVEIHNDGTLESDAGDVDFVIVCICCTNGVDQQRTLHIDHVDEIDPLQASSNVDGSETDKDEFSIIPGTIGVCYHDATLTPLPSFQHSGVLLKCECLCRHGCTSHLRTQTSTICHVVGTRRAKNNCPVQETNVPLQKQDMPFQ